MAPGSSSSQAGQSEASFHFSPVGVSPNPIRVDPSTGARRMFSGTDRFTGTREGSSEGARTSPQMPTQL